MREVTFVESLNIKRLPMGRREEVRYHEYFAPVPVPNGEILIADEAIKETVVPVHYLRSGNRNVRDSMYIAYSKEVQDMLGMPFDVLQRERDWTEKHNCLLRRMIQRVHGASLWQRLRYVLSNNATKLLNP